MLKWLLVLLGMAGTDYIWVKCILSVANHESMAAAHWSVLFQIISSFYVVGYVKDKWLIVPGTLGAWIGTYYGV